MLLRVPWMPAIYAIQSVAREGNLTSMRHIISPGTLPTPLKAGSTAAIVELSATNHKHWDGEDTEPTLKQVVHCE